MDGVGSEVTTITFITKNMPMERVCKKVQESELWYVMMAETTYNVSGSTTHIDQEHLSDPSCTTRLLPYTPILHCE